MEKTGGCTRDKLKLSIDITEKGFAIEWEDKEFECKCNMRSMKLEWTVMLSIPLAISEHHHQLHLYADCPICHKPIKLSIELRIPENHLDIGDPNALRPIIEIMKKATPDEEKEGKKEKIYKLSQVGTCRDHSVDDIGKVVWQTFDNFRRYGPYSKLSHNCQHFCSEVSANLCEKKTYNIYFQNFTAKGSCC